MALDDYYRAQQDVMLYESRVTSFQVRVSNIQNDLALWESLPEGDKSKTLAIRANIERKLAQTQQGLTDANSDLDNARVTLSTALDNSKADATTTINSPEATNNSESDQDTEEKYADPNNTPNEDPFEQSRQDAEDEYNASYSNDLTKDLTDASDEDNVKTTRSGVPKGAETSSQTPRASAEWAETKDLRVILRVPKAYLKGPAAGPSNILNDFGGILFPYTPTISYDNQAQYGAVNPVHSNYTQYFFKNSQVGQISISAKFTVQNEREGKVWLGVIHLLRALTKMRWGKDVGAGSPPPVCRLEGYGDFMLRNVPVVISSFKFDLPDNVDYISVGGEYKNTLVPSITTINLGLNVMYSRREMQDFSVDDWIQGNLRGQGYL
jgi:F0F1-type ATP synthase membrane subunit b/b'